MLAAVRSYLENDHRDWDLYLSEIKCSLRTSIHAATGVTPFFVVFGYHWYTNGADYNLARKLKSMTDHEITPFDRSDRLKIIFEKIKSNMHEAYEKSAKNTTRGLERLYSNQGKKFIEEILHSPILRTILMPNSAESF